VLNEEAGLEHFLSSLPRTREDEIIIVDGGSIDGTIAVASRFTDKILSARKGRGNQMNIGAFSSSGDALFFVHADCVLPNNALSTVRNTLSDPAIACGAFDIRIDHPSFVFRAIEQGANLRSRVTSIPYGDQCMFMRADVFRKLNGFADVPIMEDIEIAGRLKKEGRIVFHRGPVLTSARRWLAEGPLYTTLRDWYIALAYSLFKASPEKLVRYYRDIR